MEKLGDPKILAVICTATGAVLVTVGVIVFMSTVKVKGEDETVTPGAFDGPAVGDEAPTV